MRYYSANADLPAEGDCSLFIVHSPKAIARRSVSLRRN